MDAIDAGRRVLAEILRAQDKDLLDKALRYLITDHFQDPQQRWVFQACERWCAHYGQVLPKGGVSVLLRDKPPGTALQYEEFYDSLVALEPNGLTFQASLDALRELTAQRRTGEALAQGMEILQSGAWQGKERVQGHEAAREHVLASFASLDRELHLQDAPEGDMRVEGQEILAAYNANREAARSGSGVVATGFPELDAILGGGQQRGEVNLMVAWTNAGKTSWSAVALTHHAAVEQGKNAVVFTSETLRHQVRFKLVARHSRYIAQQMLREGRQVPPGLQAGLNATRIKAGALEGKEISLLQLTIASLRSISGRPYIAQVPRGATISTLESRLARITRMFPVDLVVIDYLALLRSDRKRQSRREELSDIMQDVKQLAATYDEGRGVPVISPWQPNREGWKAAKERGYYTTADLAETAESASTADVIFTLLAEEDEPTGRRVPLKLQVIKNRDGARLNDPLLLTADFATCWFEPRQQASMVAELPGFGDDDQEAPA